MNIALISNISVGYAPTFPFEKYLLSKDNDLSVIFHPLVNSGIKKSVLKEANTIKNQYHYSKPIKVHNYLFQTIFSLWWIFKQKKRYDFIIGMGNLNALSALILRLFNKTNKVIFYTVDYSVNRFNNKFLNFVYHQVDLFVLRNVDCVLSVSERIVKVREAQGVPREKNLLQPNGVHIKEIKKKLFKKNLNKNFFNIIFAGHITKSKGLDKILQSLKNDKDCYHKYFLLDIYGDGPYLNVLKKKVKKFGLSKLVTFKGNVTNKCILDNLHRYDIGIATYTSEDDFNYYCDPVKVKEYMAANLAIIISDVPSVASFVANNKIGIKVDNSLSSISDALREMSASNLVYSMKDNYKKLELKLDWDYIFEKNYKKYANK